MQVQEVRDFIKAHGDPFETLCIAPTAEKKEIKNAYKDMAKKYHPDKNKSEGAQDMFLKIKHAYDHLNDKVKLDAYFKYVSTIQARDAELKLSSAEQQMFANDLLRREKQAERKRQEEEKVRDMRRQEEMQRMSAEQAEIQHKKLQKEQQKLQFDLQHKDSYRKLNSIKVKWPKESTFNDKLLRLIFKVYGPIKEIVVLAQKRKAVVEYHTTEAANNAIANETSPELKVRFLMKGDKRTKLQAFLCQSRESLEKRDEEQVFSLSTDTLKRITHFYNKDSKIFVNDQKELLKRDEERRRMMEQILQEELMN